MHNPQVHFLGIGGSGISAAAAIAHAQGFNVTGCDLEADTPYLTKIKQLGIKVALGHDSRHLNGVDLLVVTPAAFFQNRKHPEMADAKKQKILVTWQEFVGKNLQKGKKVIAIAGTHGKSTTTAMAALVLEKAGLDPTAILGATIPVWGGNYRAGKGDHFVMEADEFYDNFIHYQPEVIILNNIEFDHPDYFASEDQVWASFKRFVEKLKGKKILIYNQDDAGIQKLLDLLDPEFLNSITTFPYSPQKETVDLTVSGKHNVANALGVVKLGQALGLDDNLIKQTLLDFKGIGRRLEFLGGKNGVEVYDDYAHHPTAIAATLAAVRQSHPQARIWAVVEPHTFSRTKALLPLYQSAFINADLVLIAPIFKSRDKKTFGVSPGDIVAASGHANARALGSFAKIAADIKKRSQKGDVVVVMGAGKSYLLARQILETL